MLRLIISLFLIFCLKSSETIKSFGKQSGISCEFRDTVNISSGFEDLDGNFHHGNDVYPRGLFASYDYVIESFKNQKISVATHVRGCICEIKPCIRICSREKFGNSTSFVVPTKDDEEEVINIFEGKYGVLGEKPCYEMANLVPEEYPIDKWYFVVSSLQ